MQAERHAVPGGEFAHTGGAFVVERGDGVGRGIELDVDVAHAVFRRPLDALFEPDAATQIDTDAFAQSHCPLLADSF